MGIRLSFLEAGNFSCLELYNFLHLLCVSTIFRFSFPNRLIVVTLFDALPSRKSYFPRRYSNWSFIFHLHNVKAAITNSDLEVFAVSIHFSAKYPVILSSALVSCFPEDLGDKLSALTKFNQRIDNYLIAVKKETSNHCSYHWDLFGYIRKLLCVLFIIHLHRVFR
ncbi:hypothetical protein PUMCH_000921 [Australozyma saopauloensis]|uniref:Uncharacterized protein n=1 Tax=Australozyma saopauloensis TaxID=291208 RepID=A0AAX4H603_9ASCO|nr:hypothetical protein PUMCH_000921 [[Candida] saopauloensis]